MTVTVYRFRSSSDRTKAINKQVADQLGEEIGTASDPHRLGDLVNQANEEFSYLGYFLSPFTNVDLHAAMEQLGARLDDINMMYYDVHDRPIIF